MSANLKDTKNAKRGVKETQNKAHDFHLIISEDAALIKLLPAREFEEALCHLKPS